MEPKTVTTIDKLIIGDRFYMVSDKRKEVFEVVKEPTKVTRFQTYKYFAKKDRDRFPTAFNRSTSIVFLRHTSNKFNNT